MATITVTIPDTPLPGIAADARGSLGEAVDGLDNARARKRAATAAGQAGLDSETAALADAEADRQGVV